MPSQEPDITLTYSLWFFFIRNISVINPSKPGEKYHSSVAKHAMQEELPSLVLSAQLRRFKLANFCQSLIAGNSKHEEEGEKSMEVNENHVIIYRILSISHFDQTDNLDIQINGLESDLRNC